MTATDRESGYGLCYLDARRGVGTRLRVPPQAMPDSPVNQVDPLEARWLSWGRSAFAVTVVIVLIALGIANIAMYSRWHEVEDGVLWSARAEGVTAIEVAPGSAAAAAGIDRGDVLLAVNNSPVQTPAEVVEFQH